MANFNLANSKLAETLIGKNMKAHPDCLGLYIGLDEMYIAQTSQKDGGTVLESLLRVPVSDVDRTQLKPLDLNESYFQMDNWLESLTKVASRKKWKTNKVVVSLASPFCLLRHFVIPTVIERKNWKTSIPLQARKYIHFPFEKGEYAYHVYEFETAATKQKKMGVVFAMTSKVILERLSKGLRSAGLELVSVEPSVLSLSRAFDASDKEAIGNGGRIYSFFGKDLASFVFLNEGAPVLLREVEISGSLPAERRRFEITNCTEFIAKQLEKDPFEEAVIVGHDVDNWITALEADSKKPVRKWNLTEVYGIETKSAGEVSAIGASGKFYDSKAPDLDFVKGSRLSDYEFNAALMAWKIAVLVVAVFLIMIVKGYFGVQKTESQLKHVKATNANPVKDFEGLTASQISNNLSQIKSQNSNLEKFLKSNPITPLLVEFVDAIPAEVWITKMEYKDKFPAESGKTRSFKITGSIKSGGDGQADLALGDKYRRALMEMPLISSICGQEAQISYQDVSVQDESDDNFDKPRAKDASAKKASNETTFSLECGKEEEKYVR